jgi:hypothetical protein
MLNQYFTLLDLNSNATIGDLKKAFRKKAKQYHPDVNSSPDAQEEFIRIHTAYEMVLDHLQGKNISSFYKEAVDEAEKRKRDVKMRAERYAKMKYEAFKKESDAYTSSPYAWIFKILYYGLYYLYMFCAFVFAFVPVWAGIDGGVFYFAICLPLFVVSYYTVKMANGWKKEIEPLFE